MIRISTCANSKGCRLFVFLTVGLVTAPLMAQRAPESVVQTLPRAEPSAVGLDETKLGQIESTMQKMVDEERISGAVVGVARRGKLAALFAVGHQDKGSSQRMKVDTIFRIWSMTKPVTTVAAMILVDEGKLKLDDPVDQYLPGFAQAGVFVGMEGEQMRTEPLVRAVTIRDLMRHTAGLTYGVFGNSPVDKLYRQKKVLDFENENAEMVRELVTIPLIDQPGTRFNYSMAADVLGHVVEKVSGQSLDRFMRERIFEPLGMLDTGFQVPDESISRFATSYSATPGAGLQVYDQPDESRFAKPAVFLSGGGGLVSTASDYLRFAQMMLNDGEFAGERILKPTSVEAMISNQLPTKALPYKMFGFPRPGLGFGLGVRVVMEAKLPGQVVGEYGWDGIASTHYWAVQEQQLAVVVLTQVRPFSQQAMAAVKPLVYDALQPSADTGK